MPTLHELNWLIKGTFILSHSSRYLFVHCRNIHSRLLRSMPPNFPTHVDAFISIFWGVVLHFIMWVGIFFCKKKEEQKALGVLFCIFAFFCTILGRGYGRGGVGCAVVLLFSCEAKSEKVLYCCVQSWPPRVGLIRWVFTWRETWKNQFQIRSPSNKKLMTPVCVFSSSKTVLLLAHSRKIIHLWLDRRLQKSWDNLKMFLNTK